MENRSLLQTFAVDKDGRIRSVDEVSRGLACECRCPCCGEPVIARQGSIREWHFAHPSGADCTGAAESALHLAAKQVLVDAQGVTLPEIHVTRSVCLGDGRTGQGEAVRRPAWIDFVRAELEQQLGQIRPDLIADTGDSVLVVEIAVTHFVDEDKRRALKSVEIPAVEINLACIYREQWGWDDLREVVVEGTAAKSWLWMPHDRLLEEEALKKAYANAQQVPIVASATLPRKPPRTRYWVGQRMVDVIERPFGLAVWSPYDPALNEQLKAIMRVLGGLWQPRFRNWLVPTEAKPYLLEELARISGRAPEKH